MLYFGILKDFFEGERDVVELEPGTDVAGLMELLRGGDAGEAGVWGSLAVAVNREYAGVGTVLKDGDEVALLPPVSGGCVDAQVSEARPGAPECVGVMRAR